MEKDWSKIYTVQILWHGHVKNRLFFVIFNRKSNDILCDQKPSILKAYFEKCTTSRSAYTILTFTDLIMLYIFLIFKFSSECHASKCIPKMKFGLLEFLYSYIIHIIFFIIGANQSMRAVPGRWRSWPVVGGYAKNLELGTWQHWRTQEFFTWFLSNEPAHVHVRAWNFPWSRK